MRSAHPVDNVRAAEAALMSRLPDGELMQRAAAALASTCADLLRGGPAARGPGAGGTASGTAGAASAGGPDSAPVPGCGADPSSQAAFGSARRAGAGRGRRRGGGVYGSRVVLLVGSGDNGGDALFAGARLARRGARVRALLLAPERAHRAGLEALLAAGGRVVTEHQQPFARADLVLDGITGIGGRGVLRPDAARAGRAAEDSGALIVAVDLPSGVDADTGEVHGEAVRADVTVTFGTHKPGLLVDPGAAHAGVVRFVDIGLAPAELGTPAAVAFQHHDIAALLPRPTPESDKYRRGVVGIAAGSGRYPGAAVLAVSAALHGGAGAVRYAGSAARDVVRARPETLVTEGGPKDAGRVQAWVVGPGLADGPLAEQTLDEVLAADVPVLVDADGLRLLARRGTAPARALLTPHAGEAVALLAGVGTGVTRDQVEAARLPFARLLARRYGCAVLLKGSTTVIASPDPSVPVRINPTGTSWLATAGSGDVLSGLAGSLLAAGLDPLDAGTVAAYLHGLAGRGDAPVTATEVAARLPEVWRAVALRGAR
ncbi:NAD(P)H-hydrate dehydratase [Streptacidiphilus monticola]|uniref:Multifunctional fusion protein n=1 Tax=Streptacidiphilus monticola TaxID=2161674 RepID=A0ABW1GAB5_9ACTN